jgi:cytochrome c-type biogenesis protein CcmE
VTEVGVAPARHDPDGTAPVAAGRGTARGRRRRRLAVVFVLLAGAVAYLLVEGLGSSLDYFDTVAQAFAHKEKIGTTTIRLEGLVVAGSIHRSARGADFEVSGGGHTVRVDNVGSPPQLFQPDIPVVVVGHFANATSDVFVSDQIMVKHSATYIAAHPTRVRAPNGTVH